MLGAFLCIENSASFCAINVKLACYRAGGTGIFAYLTIAAKARFYLFLCGKRHIGKHGSKSYGRTVFGDEKPVLAYKSESRQNGSCFVREYSSVFVLFIGSAL